MYLEYHQEFQKIVTELFKLMEYKVRGSRGSYVLAGKDKGYELIAEKEERYYVSLKFYRRKSIPVSALKEMSHRLAYITNEKKDGSGLLVVNTVVPAHIIRSLNTEYGVSIWGREILHTLLAQYSLELRDQFERLLLAAQQGNEIYDVFQGLQPREPELNYGSPHPPISQPLQPRGESFRQQLAGVPRGQKGWTAYEDTCIDILKYLFEDDLVLWEKQQRTDDGLSRFDLICRIASGDDYWKAIISSFNTRFVLFEFKNYTERVTQDQVFATERYLYTKGLRSVGFLITTNGPTPSAEQAAKGALKENGKLIMFLTNEDLDKMLELKDRLESVNDYLSGLLDKWLISLSR